MKQRVIALFLCLLLLTLTLVTGVFAEPGDETDAPTEAAETLAPEPVPTTEASAPAETTAEPEPPETVPEEPSEPAATEEAPETEPATEPEPETEPATEPEPEPEPDVNIYHLDIMLTLDEDAPKQDFLFTIQSDEVYLQVVVPAGETKLTIYGLPEGHYKVTEERGWSWRFDVDAEAEALSRSSWLFDERVENWVSFRPVAGESKWLSDRARGDGT